MNISTHVLSANNKLYIIIVFCFIIPWFIGIFLYFKDKQLIVTIAPFACAIGFILNTIGIDLGCFYPLQIGNIKPHTLAIFPNVGLLTIESCIFIFMVHHSRIKLLILNLVLTTIASVIDSIFLYTNILVYKKGWNIPFTLLTYFLTFYIIYFYYLRIKKLLIIPTIRIP
jgi:hypothetical protein